MLNGVTPMPNELDEFGVKSGNDDDDWICLPYLGRPPRAAVAWGYLQGFCLMMTYLILVPAFTLKLLLWTKRKLLPQTTKKTKTKKKIE